LYLLFLNRQHAKRREELGKNIQLVDESMISKNQMASGKAAEAEEGHDEQAEGGRRAIEEDNGLRDMTDLKNEDFIYVY